MINWQLVLLEPAKTVLAQIGQFLVNLLLVILILIVGWLIAQFIKRIVTTTLKAMKVDDFSRRVGLNDILQKGGISYPFSDLMGIMCYWLVLVITFVVALSSINLITASLLDKIISYVPNVIAAIFILIMGMFVATLLRNVVQTATSNVGVMQSTLLAKVTELIIMIFAIFMALEQLQIGKRISEITLSIVLGAIGLAFALAFGLGCKDLAGRLMSDLMERFKGKE